MNAPVIIAAGRYGEIRGAPPGSIAELAWHFTEHARTLGLVVVRMLCSRVRGSPSKHIELRDGRNRRWIVRISDHHAPEGTGYDIPHFDLVSRDGASGYEAAIGWINQVAAGAIAWSPPERSRQRRGHHVRGQKHKPGGCR